MGFTPVMGLAWGSATQRYTEHSLVFHTLLICVIGFGAGTGAAGTTGAMGVGGRTGAGTGAGTGAETGAGDGAGGATTFSALYPSSPPSTPTGAGVAEALSSSVSSASVSPSGTVERS